MANITVTIDSTAQGTSVQDQGYYIKKDINAFDFFVAQIGRAPIATDVVKFVVEENVCIIGTLNNLSGLIEEPNPYSVDGSGYSKYYQKPLGSMGALTFDSRWSGLNPRIYLDNYGIIMGRGGDALPTIFAPGSLGRTQNHFIHWGSDAFYGTKAWGNTGIKLGNGVFDTTYFGVYVRNFGIIAGGGGAGCSVAYEHPPEEVLDSMCAGGGGGAPYGSGGKYITRPQWNGADATLFLGGAGFNRGTVNYDNLTYEQAGGNGGSWGLQGKESHNTHYNAGAPGSLYRPYQSPTDGMNSPGYYAEGSVFINNHFNSHGVQGITAGRVFLALGWDENDLPGEWVDRQKTLTAIIRGTNVTTSRLFNYKERNS
jgi:hypothetical protein